MAIYDLNGSITTTTNYDPIIPSDVFQSEPNTDIGYARMSVVLTGTNGKTARVGTLVIVDTVAKTATIPANTAALLAATTIGIYYGKDLPTNGTDFNRFQSTFVTGKLSEKVVVVYRGDGSAGVGTAYLEYPSDIAAGTKAQVLDKLNMVNRFKIIKQTAAY
mgnify:FL=1